MYAYYIVFIVQFHSVTLCFLIRVKFSLIFCHGLTCRTVLKVRMRLMLCSLYMGTLLLTGLGKLGGPFAVASGRPLEWNGFLTTSCELWKERSIWKLQSGNVGRRSWLWSWFKRLSSVKNPNSTGLAIGLLREQMNGAIKSSVITALGPSLVVLSAMIALLVSLGGPSRGCGCPSSDRPCTK